MKTGWTPVQRRVDHTAKVGIYSHVFSYACDLSQSDLLALRTRESLGKKARNTHGSFSWENEIVGSNQV